MKSLSKMTKDELIAHIRKLDREIERVSMRDSSEYCEQRYQDGWDEGVEHGMSQRTRYISNSELSDYDNVLRFG